MPKAFKKQFVIGDYELDDALDLLKKVIGPAPDTFDSIGQIADTLYTTRELRYKLQHITNDLAKRETEMETLIVDNVPKDDTGASGKTARVQVVRKPIPQVENWDKFYEYIKKQTKHNGFALLNRALNRKAANELLDAGKQLPGVGTFVALEVSCTKLK